MGSGARALCWGGTGAGILDIAAAFVLRGYYGASPVRVLQGIASGLLGPESFRGGWATAALGLAIHFFIAYVAAAVFYAATRWWPVLVRRAVPAGVAFGVVVYLVMNHAVLPLTFPGLRPSPWHYAAIMIAIHVACVGLPIALAVRRFAGESARTVPVPERVVA